MQRKLAEAEKENAITSHNYCKLKERQDLVFFESNRKYDDTTCDKHDARMTDLSKSHAQQCDDLCGEALRDNRIRAGLPVSNNRLGRLTVIDVTKNMLKLSLVACGVSYLSNCWSRREDIASG